MPRCLADIFFLSSAPFRAVVPTATMRLALSECGSDGGAPWHWQVGLGPRLDDEAPRELSAFDPYPEWLGIKAARPGLAEALVVAPDPAGPSHCHCLTR